MAAPSTQKDLIAIWTGIVLSASVFLAIYFDMAQASIKEIDVLTPYPDGFHGSPQNRRYVRECQPVRYSNITIQSHTSHGLGASNITLPIATTKQFMDSSSYFRTSFGRLTAVNNPLRTLSVLEPLEPGGCDLGLRVPVTRTAKQRKCLVAMNAGFFNTHTGDCYGNVVSDGRLIKNGHGVQNAHFGIRANGSLVFGYLSELDVLDEENPFVQLVGGVGWLLRDGEPYIEQSKKAECKNSEETGSVESFFNVVAARTAVGSDAEGRVILAHVDGKSDSTGVSLDEFAALLKRNGVVNAINLDGGGSSTYVINGTVVSLSTDECEDRVYRCPREVSTVLCAHEPDCHPVDCSGHGDCIMGECHCRGNWQGPNCQSLQCGLRNCSGNGVCTETGCQCNIGFMQPDCKQFCRPGSYGQNCRLPCQCQHGGDCDPVTGDCSCLPGYAGRHCQQICPFGYHGPKCQETCKCEDDGCICHHITGVCMSDITNGTTYAGLLKVGQCLAKRAQSSEYFGPAKTFFQDPYAVGFVIAAVVAAASLMCNIALVCYRCTCRVTSQPFMPCPTLKRRKYQLVREMALDFEDTEESESSL